MEGFKQECKLCGNIIRDENFKVIEDVIKTIDIDILLLKLMLDTRSVICSMCSSKLLAALDFKSTCLYTDNTIIPYIDFENPRLVDLKDIYVKVKESKLDGIMLDDREICRLCLKPMSSDHKSILEVPVDSIQIYIPEIILMACYKITESDCHTQLKIMALSSIFELADQAYSNFAVTTNPAICLECHDALHVHSTFIKNCLDAEEKSNTDAAHVGDMLLTNPPIKMEEIEIKSEETDETLSEDLYNLKKEENDEGNASLSIPNDLIDMEETKSLYNLDESKQTVASDKSKEWFYKATGDYNNRRSKSLTVGKYQCHTCMFNTRFRASFINHLIIHKDPSEVQMFKCDECDFKSIRKGVLKQHKLKHKDPSEVPMFKCDECKFITKYKLSLKEHLLKHKDLKCDECDYKCIKKFQLNRHQLKHKNPSEVQMYGCDKCKFVTKYKEGLGKHYLQHKDPSEVQMYVCGECDYKNIEKGKVKRHELKHKNASEVQMYKCDKCKFVTKYKGGLIKHYVRHKDPSEVRMFQCDECDYKSIQKGNLKLHQLRHKDPSEVRVFKCDECDYKSIEKGNLLRHQLRHKAPSKIQMQDGPTENSAQDNALFLIKY